MTDTFSLSPHPTYRLIPSRFPPIGLFDTVATASDLPAVLDLAGWTSDRLVGHRLKRLPQSDWAFGRPNTSIVMASFLHVAPGGMRFNGPELGAWYAAAAERTGIVEVAHHLRREAFATGLPSLSRKYRVYTATLDGSYMDIRGQQANLPTVYDPLNYAGSQALGESVRQSGENGIIYDSLRHAGGTNTVVHRPNSIVDIMQTKHFDIKVLVGSLRVEVSLLVLP